MRSADGGHELLRGHLEATVAVDRPHHAVGPADLGADRRRHRVAHRAEPAGVHPRVRLLELPELARPHLVLTDTRREDAVVGRVLAQLLDDELRLERPAFFLRVLQRVRRLPFANLRDPRRDVGRTAGFCCSALTALIISSITVRTSPTIGTSATTHLAELGGVDVDVDDLGVGRERRRPCRSHGRRSARPA